MGRCRDGEPRNLLVPGGSSVVWGGRSGVWRINAFRTGGLSGSGIELISPTIGYDSHLFDRVRVRFRTVHHSPTTGDVLLRWTNEHNLMYPGSDPLPGRGRFSLPANGTYGELVYTTEWQEFEFSLVDMEENFFCVIRPKLLRGGA